MPCPSLSHGAWASSWELGHFFGEVSKAGALDLRDMHPPSPQEAEPRQTDVAEHRAGAASTVTASLSSFVAVPFFLHSTEEETHKE